MRAFAEAEHIDVPVACGLEFCGLDQGQDAGGALAALVGTCEEPVLAPQCNGSDVPLRWVVADFNGALFDEEAESCPSGECIADRLRRAGLSTMRAIR